MKKKIISAAALILILCSFCTTPVHAEADVREIGTIEDLKELFEKGGSGILTNDLYVSEEELRISAYTVVDLEVGSYPLILDQCHLNISGTLSVTSRNEIRPGEIHFTQNVERESFFVKGSLILDHVRLYAGIIEGGGTIYSFSGGVRKDSFNGNVIGFNDYAYELGYPHSFGPELFAGIFETGKLVRIETTTYKAEEWVDETTGTVVTVWKNDGKDHSYRPIWKSPDSVVSALAGTYLGNGTLWPAFTFLFAGVAAVFAILLWKEKKKNRFKVESTSVNNSCREEA